MGPVGPTGPAGPAGPAGLSFRSARANAAWDDAVTGGAPASVGSITATFPRVGFAHVIASGYCWSAAQGKAHVALEPVVRQLNYDTGAAAVMTLASTYGGGNAGFGVARTFPVTAGQHTFYLNGLGYDTLRFDCDSNLTVFFADSQLPQ
jgi:hypothetical protein